MNVMVPRRSVPAIVAVLAGCTFAAFRMRQIAPRPALPPPQPQWLTIDQAARYTGLSEKLLRRLITAGKLTVMPDGVLKVRRVELDKLEGLGMNLAAAAGELRQAMRGRR